MSFRPLCPPLIRRRKAQAADGQGEVVEHDHHIRRRQLIEIHRRPHTSAAHVHVRRRLEQQQASLRRRSSTPPVDRQAVELAPRQLLELIAPGRSIPVERPTLRPSRSRRCAAFRRTRDRDFQGRRRASSSVATAARRCMSRPQNGRLPTATTSLLLLLRRPRPPRRPRLPSSFR